MHIFSCTVSSLQRSSSLANELSPVDLNRFHTVQNSDKQLQACQGRNSGSENLLAKSSLGQKSDKILEFEEARRNPDKNMKPLSGWKVPFRDQASPTIARGPLPHRFALLKSRAGTYQPLLNRAGAICSLMGPRW